MNEKASSGSCARGDLRAEHLKFEISEDCRPWWKRLFSSLRISLKPGKSFRRPVGYIGVTGKVEF